MNLSLVAPPISARTVPPSTEGVMFSVLKGAQPAVTLGLIESTEDGFFENGATFMWTAGSRSSSRRRCRAASRSAAKSGPSRAPRSTRRRGCSSRRLTFRVKTVQGAWTLNVTVDQFVWMHPNDPDQGHGRLRHVRACPTATRAFSARRRSSASAARRRSRAAARIHSARRSYYNDISNDLEDTVQPIRLSGSATNKAWSSTTPGRPSAGAASPPTCKSSTRFSAL